jgi:predicted aspartyl protease
MNEAQCGYSHSPKGGDLLVLHGPSLKVDIGLDRNYVAGFGGRPKLDIKGIDALIDTGASEDFIDQSLATELGLPLVDRRSVSAALSTDMANVYMAQIHVIALDRVILGRFAALALRSNDFAFDVVLGRTFLRRHSFTYDGRTGDVVIRRLDGAANIPSTGG